MLAVVLLCPLVVAGILKPDRRGHGTHRQLGLPPCTVVVLFGQRCPTCGMTTAWSHLVRGQVLEAFRANVGGAILALVDLAAVPWLLWSAIRGRWLGWVPNGNVLAAGMAAILAVTLIDWAVRLLCS